MKNYERNGVLDERGGVIVFTQTRKEGMSALTQGTSWLFSCGHVGEAGAFSKRSEGRTVHISAELSRT